MTAPLLDPLVCPIQLRLDLPAPSAQRCRPAGQQPFWDYIDTADLGGALRARRLGVQALVTADKRPDGSWIGYHDLVLGSGGTSGPTRPHSTRVDALVSAAYDVVSHCETVLSRNGSAPRGEAKAARQLVRWLRNLDLL